MGDVVNMLVIRDPDFENDYTYDAPINVITIDIGGDWRDYKDFCSCLRDGDADALDYETAKLAEVAHLDAENAVRKAVVEYFQMARQ